jgi:AcrR family transcriptional regulator
MIRWTAEWFDPNIDIRTRRSRELSPISTAGGQTNSTVRKKGEAVIKQQQDKRLQQTRAWILQAFNELIFKRNYADLRTGNIIRRAGVGRSTFYEHFRNKDAVLITSAEWILIALADAMTDAASPH